MENDVMKSVSYGDLGESVAHEAVYPPSEGFLPNGEARPVGVSGKPVMSRREANWHAHQAGVLERGAAERAGVDEDVVGCEVVQGLLPAGAVRIGGVVVPAVTYGTMVTIRAVAKLFAGDVGELVDTGALSLYATLHAQEVQGLLAGAVGEEGREAVRGEILRRAMEMANGMPMGTAGAIDRYVLSQLQESEAVGK